VSGKWGLDQINIFSIYAQQIKYKGKSSLFAKALNESDKKDTIQEPLD
jgi:hypothetical protein